jgi:predicted metalloendopeptidase
MMINEMLLDESNTTEFDKLDEREQSLVKNRVELATRDAQRKVDDERKILGNKELAFCIMKERAKRRDIKNLKEGKRLYHNLVEDVDDFDEIVNEVRKLSYLDGASIFCILVFHRNLNDIRVVAD